MDLNIKNLAPETRTALAKVLAFVMSMAAENPLPIERVAELFEREPQVHLMVEGLLGVLPVDPDPDQWLAWLSGGAAPVAQVALADPDRDRKSSARGAQHSAATRWAEARRKVRDLTSKLDEAKADLDTRTAELREVNNQLRAVVAFRMITEAGRLFAAPFAMGPMWTLVRAVSGYLRVNVAYESSLDVAQLASLAEHRLTRKESTARILELLDWHCGDVALEVKIHDMLLATLEAHHQPVAEELAFRKHPGQRLSEAAKRGRRSSDERRARVRPGAPIADRKEVLDGLRREQSSGDPEPGAGDL